MLFSLQERAARTAAKNLFVSMARGGDFVTARQLEEQLIERLRERLGTKYEHYFHSFEQAAV